MRTNPGSAPSRGLLEISRRVAALAACAALLPAPARALGESASISIGLGQQKVIQVGSVARIAIGDPEVADVKQVGGGDLLVTGVSEGRTSLLVWKTNQSRASYVVLVRKQDPKEVVSEIRALLGDREGIQIRVVGEHVYLDGETLTTDDQERLQQIATLYPNVKSFVRPSSNAKRLAAEALNKALQKEGLKGAQATVLGNALFLEGSVEAKEDIARADLVVRAIGEKAENLLTVGVKRMVLVEVDFVEVSYQDNKQVGIKPPLHLVSADGSGAILQIVKPLRSLGDLSTQPVASISGTLNTTTDFSVGARFDSGVVRVLSQPRLVCASGEKAEFTAGGEVPILVVTQNQFSVAWKKFGIVLNITPTVDRQGNIGTEVYAEVSDVDRSLSVRANGFEVPGFRLRDVKTNVTVKDGETIALSGLFTYNQDKEVSKVPFFGHIPILGELFKSRSFVDRKTELAIYVTPHIATPNSGEIKGLIQDARKLYKDAGGQLSFSIFD
jgi:pilus assembly protein CpaC